MPIGPQDSRELLRIFEEQNPWQRDGQVPALLAPQKERPLAQRLWRMVQRPDIRRYPLILGPRRVGKTTLMYQTVRHLIEVGTPINRLWWLRLDHPVLLRYELDVLAWSILEHSGRPAGGVYLFLDEIVYARQWDLWLKTFYDDHWPVHVVATSSATAALRDRRLESGVGRWSEEYLPPYLFSEFLDLAGQSPPIEIGRTLAETLAGLPPYFADVEELAPLRNRFLLVGGFPELLLGAQDDDETQLLRSQQVLRSDAVERAVYKDIPQSFGLDNPMALERLLYVLAAQVTGLLSPARICSELGFSQPTFDRYLSYLEQAFLVFTLPNFSGRETNVQKRGRKLYFVDGAVRNAALQRGIAPVEDPAEHGLLVENLVAANLHALALASGVRLFHWRDGRHEVDLVFDHPDEPLAFEVGSSPHHSRAGLAAFVDRHPKFRNRCWFVAPGERVLHPDRTSRGVGTIPLDLFLVVVGRQAERLLDERFGPA